MNLIIAIAWGRNNASQTNVPTNLTNAIAVAAGGDQSLALLNNGTVTNWGAPFGSIPASVTNIIAIAAGTNFSVGAAEQRDGDRVGQ